MGAAELLSLLVSFLNSLGLGSLFVAVGIIILAGVAIGFLRGRQ